ncbi:MAG: hypothetical protein P4M09_05735 [Devosia sp.]|nr:hypothetical protein [Devosia sp.]
MRRHLRRAHRRIWIVLAVLLPLLLLGALALRQGDPREAAPIRLPEQGR